MNTPLTQISLKRKQRSFIRWFLWDFYAGMNRTVFRLIEVSMAIGISFGFAISMFPHNNYRTVFIGIILLLLLFVLAWAMQLCHFFLFCPFPPCERNKCLARWNYYWPLGYFFGRIGLRRYLYKCQCGDEYLRVGKIFFRVLSDGSLKPYTRKTSFNKWEKVLDAPSSEDKPPLRVENTGKSFFDFLWTVF